MQRPGIALGACTAAWHSVPGAGATQRGAARRCRGLSNVESPCSSTGCGRSGAEPGTAELGAAQDRAALLSWHMGWALAGKTQGLYSAAAPLSTQTWACCAGPASEPGISGTRTEWDPPRAQSCSCGSRAMGWFLPSLRVSDSYRLFSAAASMSAAMPVPLPSRSAPGPKVAHVFCLRASSHSPESTFPASIASKLSPTFVPRPPKWVLDLSPGAILHHHLFQTSLCPLACLPGSPSLLSLSSGACPTWEGVPCARSTLGAGQPGLPHPWMPSTSTAVGAGLCAGAGRAQLPAAGALGAHAMALGLASTANAAISFLKSLCLPREAAEALSSPCAAWPCSGTALRLPLLLLLFIDSTEHPLLLIFAVFLQRAGSDERDPAPSPLWLYSAGPAQLVPLCGGHAGGLPCSVPSTPESTRPGRLEPLGSLPAPFR